MKEFINGAVMKAPFFIYLDISGIVKFEYGSIFRGLKSLRAYFFAPAL